MTKSRKGRDGYTVSKDGNDWKLTRNHSERASGTFDTQAEAIQRGKDLAREAAVDLTIMGRDGKIRSKDSYGNDPLPPRDTEH